MATANGERGTGTRGTSEVFSQRPCNTTLSNLRKRSTNDLFGAAVKSRTKRRVFAFRAGATRLRSRTIASEATHAVAGKRICSAYEALGVSIPLPSRNRIRPRRCIWRSLPRRSATARRRVELVRGSRRVVPARFVALGTRDALLADHPDGRAEALRYRRGSDKVVVIQRCEKRSLKPCATAVLRFVRARSVDLWHGRSHRAQVGRDLPPMMDDVEEEAPRHR